MEIKRRYGFEPSDRARYPPRQHLEMLLLLHQLQRMIAEVQKERVLAMNKQASIAATRDFLSEAGAAHH